MARNARPEVTRQRILDAAKKLFAQKGYERTTIQDIPTSSRTSARALSTIISKTKKRCCMR